MAASTFNQKDGVSLQKYFDDKIRDLKEYFEKILDEKEKALNLATGELSKHLEKLNGETGKLDRMQATYLPREVADAKFNTQDEKIDDLESWKDKQEGKASQSSVIGAYILFLINLALAIWGLLK